jgi:hypothetical protein
MATKTIQEPAPVDETQAQKLKDTEEALREYQQSRQFTDDLVQTFAAASKRAREENFFSCRDSQG